jgi:murein DD-endopeptidase MepM/ murein hydrolase activator NlpD
MPLASGSRRCYADGMRRGAVSLFAFAFAGALGCVSPASDPQYVASYAPPPQLAAAGPVPGVTGVLVERMAELVFDGGRIEIETRRDGARVIELARNRFVVPLVMHWRLDDLQNLSPTGPLVGVAVLPPAASPNGAGPALVLATTTIDDMYQPFSRDIRVHARFGDPDAHPTPYAYRVPFKAGATFSVLQGFHGAFSHRGSNEYAVDFDCPVATPVVAARPGLVVAAHADAQGAGTTPEFMDYRRTNFVLVLHDDGTLGEYMHLAPSGVRVTVGQRVARGDELALSGNTGFSSTPHLHFQVMTAATDGFSAQSFPFELAVSARRVEAPVQGRAYPSWE